MDTLTTPPVVTGTSLAVLAPYLPYGIPVRDIDNAGPFGGDTHILLGLDTQAEFPVLVGAGGESSDIAYAYHGVLPVLRPFSQLCDPLPDGTVPAVEVAKLLANDWAAQYSYTIETVHGNRISVLLMQWDEEVGETVVGYISVLADWMFHLADESEILHLENVLEAYDYLRSQHFAVGLEPHQFVAK